MIRFALARCLVCLVLVGCVPSDDAFDALFGIRKNVVVLTSTDLELSDVPTRFTPATETEAVGGESSVCVVLAGNVEGKAGTREVERILHGARLAAVVTTTDGVAHEFKTQASRWARAGRVVPSNEIAACVQADRAMPAISIGSRVRSIAVSATSPVHALGVYWASTNAFDRDGK